MLAFMIYLHFLKILIQFLSDLAHSKGLDRRHARDMLTGSYTQRGLSKLSTLICHCGVFPCDFLRCLVDIVVSTWPENIIQNSQPRQQHLKATGTQT